jgi:hypothetical protein
MAFPLSSTLSNALAKWKKLRMAGLIDLGQAVAD